jgi:pimeloyl-ACP methyl ester carboxylesterase
MTKPVLPGGFERHWTDIGGIRIHDVGIIDRSRPTVVLVPGIGLSHRVMIPIAELLAPYLAVRAPDPPGFGRSDKPRRPLALPELADALAAWIDAAGLGRPALVGNSFGCQVIVELAARHPDRVACAVLQGPTMDPAARSLPSQTWRWLRDTVQERPDPWARLRDYRDAGLCAECWPPTGWPCATASRTSSPGSSPPPWSCVVPTTRSSPRPGPRPWPACSRRASWWSPTPAPIPSSTSWSRSRSRSSSATSRQQAETTAALVSSARIGT